MQDDVKQSIVTALDLIEQEHGVKVVHAAETGSRAWGFESTDSDYDVRFVYVRPTNDYLSVYSIRDVIEIPITGSLDITGWDIKKALQLLRKSNPPLLERLQSPFVYRDVNPIASRMRSLVSRFYSPKACSHHYFNMAEQNYRSYLKGADVWYKKYLYVLRPILACRWIERDIGPVPIEFQKLVDATVDDGDVLLAIQDLVRSKKRGFESDCGPAIPAISDFIIRELARLDAAKGQGAVSSADPAELDTFFRETLGMVWAQSV